MKIETKELTGAALDYAVALALGAEPRDDYGRPCLQWPGACVLMDAAKNPRYITTPDYSTSWSQAGPIIERELISVEPNFLSAGYERPNGAWEWRASCVTEDDKAYWLDGPTPLIAAMRCFVASKLGDTVDIPDELIKE